MKNLKLLFFAAVVSASVMARASHTPCPEPWMSSLGPGCDMTLIELEVVHPIFKTTKTVHAKIRNGYLPEAPGVPFKGNILYFEGLGDSMLNHLSFFKRLTAIGYRVIAFDYMGQGGSTGRMNDTRIRDIPTVGWQVLQKHGRDLNAHPKPVVIGWSTGGLAAYLTASKGWADKVVLLAPGIKPNFIVGEGIHWGIPDEITMRTLTSASSAYSSTMEDPHVDPIRPISPIKVATFAIDLQLTARSLRKSNVRIPKDVAGYLFSGCADNYVDCEKNREAIEAAAPHFSITEYAQGLHEIHNEVPAITDSLFDKTCEFLLK
jgi:alpha-beta hydrolase superfamily lysophospholipase